METPTKPGALCDELAAGLTVGSRNAGAIFRLLRGPFQILSAYVAACLAWSLGQPAAEELGEALDNEHERPEEEEHQYKVEQEARMLKRSSMLQIPRRTGTDLVETSLSAIREEPSQGNTDDHHREKAREGRSSHGIRLLDVQVRSAEMLNERR
jgi:hypothetical protein